MNRVDWYGPNVWAWNPLAMLCDRVSAGCANCWHRRMAPRLAANPKFSEAERAAWAGTGPPVLRARELDAPLRRKKPSIIAVQFMGDLFHSAVSDGLRADVWRTMADAAQHRYLLLTKRSWSMRGWLERTNEHRPSIDAWLGISVSTQDELNRRLPDLLRCPAAGRWLSIEPMLGPISLAKALQPEDESPPCACGDDGCHPALPPPINWVVVGAETGPGARPMHPDWARGVRDECVAAGVLCYLKQLDASGHRVLDGRTWDERPADPGGTGGPFDA